MLVTGGTVLFVHGFATACIARFLRYRHPRIEYLLSVTIGNTATRLHDCNGSLANLSVQVILQSLLLIQLQIANRQLASFDQVEQLQSRLRPAKQQAN